MTAAAVATLTSGNEQRYAETAAVLAIAVGAGCVRMASAAWLLADGLWVCGHLRAAGLATRALVLTMYDDVTVLAALRAGRTATHSRSRTERDRRRRTVSARGEALFGAGIAAGMLQHFGRAATSSPFFSSSPKVRPRSWGCWPRGRDNAGVARRLRVSPKTVHNHASNIISKLHVSDRSGAILRARDVGLGEPGRAELPLPTWCQEARVPSSMIIDDECARCH